MNTGIVSYTFNSTCFLPEFAGWQSLIAANLLCHFSPVLQPAH
jgi:hypothetical protein